MSYLAWARMKAVQTLIFANNDKEIVDGEDEKRQKNGEFICNFYSQLIQSLSKKRWIRIINIERYMESKRWPWIEISVTKLRRMPKKLQTWVSCCTHLLEKEEMWGRTWPTPVRQTVPRWLENLRPKCGKWSHWKHNKRKLDFQLVREVIY